MKKVFTIFVLLSVILMCIACWDITSRYGKYISTKIFDGEHNEFVGEYINNRHNYSAKLKRESNKRYNSPAPNFNYYTAAVDDCPYLLVEITIEIGKAYTFDSIVVESVNLYKDDLYEFISDSDRKTHRIYLKYDREAIIEKRSYSVNSINVRNDNGVHRMNMTMEVKWYYFSGFHFISPILIEPINLADISVFWHNIFETTMIVSLENDSSIIASFTNKYMCQFNTSKYNFSLLLVIAIYM